MSLAAQKFIANITHDSLQIYKQRRKQTLARLKEQGLKDQKTTLLTEDLAEALQEVYSSPTNVAHRYHLTKIRTSRKPALMIPRFRKQSTPHAARPLCSFSVKACLYTVL